MENLVLVVASVYYDFSQLPDAIDYVRCSAYDYYCTAAVLFIRISRHFSQNAVV